MTDQNDIAKADERIARLNARAEREAELLKGKRPCPFCGSVRLSVTDWWDDDGEYPAIECDECKGSSPAVTWNLRRYG